MSYQGGYSRPPPVPPPRPNGGFAPPPPLPRREPSGGPGLPPPLPVSSKPNLPPAPTPAPAAARSVLDDPDVITACPENEMLHATAYWYTTPEVPGVEICSHCFATHIRTTQWASRFERRLKQPDPARRCRFSTPRMLQLWPQVVRNNDWSYISGYLAHRAKITDCKGLAPVGADAGIHWYKLRDNEIENFIICSACYEDVALATPFGNHFQPSPGGQPAGTQWICDMTKFGRRAMERFGKTNSWRQLIQSVDYSMKVEKCTGAAGVLSIKQRWYRPKQTINHMVVCEACYFDYVAASFMENEWEQALIPTNATGNIWVCDMDLLPMKVALMKCYQVENFGIFWNAAREILANPQCGPTGISGGTCYRLRRGPEALDICPQCFAGIIKTLGFADHFVQVQVPPSDKRICDMSASSPRRAQYLSKLDEAVAVRHFSAFEEYAIKFGPIPTCQTSTPVSNRPWWGTNDFTACQNCWEEFVKHTSLATQFTRHGVVLPQAVCDFYSPRMRGLWTEACTKGDMTEFTAFAQRRAAIYAQTVPQMQQMLAIAKMRLATKQTLMMSSIMLTGTDGIVGASRPAYDHTSYGNSDIGYGYATMAGARGANQFNQAVGMDVVQGGDLMQVAQLEAMWKQVE